MANSFIRKRKENAGCISLMHGTDARYWCMVGRVPEFVHYTHTWPCTAQTVGQWKKLARSRDLNTRPLLATSLNQFYNTT